jgi:protein O-GlcNAc transferase
MASPLDIPATFSRATLLHQQGKLKDAAPLYLRILSADPGCFDAHHMLGLLRAQQGRFLEAVKAIAHALKISPRSEPALVNFGNVLRALGQGDQALLSYDTALSVNDKAPETWFNRGLLLWDLRRFDEALASYDRALALAPDYAQALLSRAATLRELGRLDEALASSDAAIRINPHLAEAFDVRGTVLWRLKRFDAALDSYNIALSLVPRSAQTLNNRGLALSGLERYEDALQSFTAATEINPDYAEALNNRGNALASLGRHKEALESYQRAIALQPDYADALINKGAALAALQKFDAALQSYAAALERHPASAAAHYNRAVVCAHLNRFDEAAAGFEAALSISPRYPYALSGAANAALNLCDWERTRNLGERLVREVAEKKSVIAPFTLLGYSGDLALQRQCAETYLEAKGAVCLSPRSGGLSRRPEKLRIAYVSPDFGAHPVGHQIVDLLERHDRTTFEITGISLGPDDGSAIRARLAAACDRFEDVHGKNDRAVAELMRRLEIDIAVDLGGHTQEARPRIFAGRPAPVQVNYLGYPATSGSRCLDYIIGDAVVTPFADQPFYSEAIVQLPGSYLVSDSRRRLGAPPSRQEAGLLQTGIVFCCFNQNWKFTAPVFGVWMRLLREIEGSTLWLRDCPSGARANLEREAQARGVDPSRLIFAGHAEGGAHLARLQLADMVLDTLPYNAHATASDALWAGVPLVTCTGEAFAGRVASSLLRAVGLGELVTANLVDYESLALRLAREPAALAAVREKLAQNRTTAPLFDTDRSRRALEAAYRHMWEARGRTPTGFAVSNAGEIASA